MQVVFWMTDSRRIVVFSGFQRKPIIFVSGVELNRTVEGRLSEKSPKVELVFAVLNFIAKLD